MGSVETVRRAMREDPERVRRMLRRIVQEAKVIGQLLPFVTATHPEFQVAEFHRRLCAALERFSVAVTMGEGPRLIIVAPPRHGKTKIASERFPVAHMAWNPGHEIICASYGQDLANDNSGAARRIARSEEAQALLPQLAPTPEDLDQVQKWTAGGSKYNAVGIGGPATGKGAHVFVVDDYVKDSASANSATKRDVAWDWFRAVASTRLAPGAGMIVMATRWHDDDLIGRLLAAPDGDEWEVLHFEAICTGQIDGDWRQPGEALHPARYPAAELERKRATLGATIFEALYQGRPVAVGGGMFRSSLWQRYQGNPRVLARSASAVWLTVDCANEDHTAACYSVIHVVGIFATSAGQRVRVLAEYRGQWEMPQLIEAHDRARREWPMASVSYIEYAANGIGLVQMARSRFTGIVAVKPRGDESYPGGDKVTRAQYTLQGLESGVGPELPSDEYAVSETGENFAVGIINEHAKFPAGVLKDRVDTLSQLMIRVLVQERRSYSIDDRRAMFGL